MLQRRLRMVVVNKRVQSVLARRQKRSDDNAHIAVPYHRYVKRRRLPVFQQRELVIRRRLQIAAGDCVARDGRRCVGTYQYRRRRAKMQMPHRADIRAHRQCLAEGTPIAQLVAYRQCYLVKHAARFINAGVKRAPNVRLRQRQH